MNTLTKSNEPLQVQHSDEIDLRELWNIIYRNKWKIITLAVSLTILAIVILFSLTPIYKATTTIMLETQSKNIVSIEQVYGIEGGNIPYNNSQIEIIKSRQNVAKVIKNLNMINHPDYDPNLKKSPLAGNQ